KPGWSTALISEAPMAARSMAKAGSRASFIVLWRRWPIALAYDRAPRGTSLHVTARPIMRIVFLTGIWPPDVGGPATHGPEFSGFLVERGHEVTVVTMGDGEPSARPCEME